MSDLSKYLAQARIWVGAQQGDGRYEEMLKWFNKNKQGYKADTENCCEFTVACALKALGLDQKYIPVINYANGQAKMWKKLAKEPVPGALAYFDYKDGKGISHVEIVTEVTPTEIKTINGNYQHKVVEMSRKKTYKYFAGFGIPNWPKEGVDMTEWQKAVAGQIEIKKGSSGTLVLWMQKYLKEQGYYLNGTLDSKFGSYMKESVKQWQRANGLYADGVVGPYCWKFILK